MESRKLGELDVSVVGLGCNNFGLRIDELQSRAVVHAALDAGITLFDTADVYGNTYSEEFLGRSLGSRRSEVVIATKFGAPVDSTREHRGASARWISEAVDASLRRLGTDYIDVYQQHLPDSRVPIDETLAALDELIEAGKVRGVGHCNFSPDQISEADTIAARNGWHRFVSAQNELSLLECGALDTVLPECRRLGLSFIPYFPLAGGLLTGKYRRDVPPASGTRLGDAIQAPQVNLLTVETFDMLDRLTAFARNRNRSLLELAFAWLLREPSICSVIAGATRPDQVRDNVDAVTRDWTLASEDLAFISSIRAQGES